MSEEQMSGMIEQEFDPKRMYQALQARLTELEAQVAIQNGRGLLGVTFPGKIGQGFVRCSTCGGEQVMIRGRLPGQDKRLVCATCAMERLEQIREISSEHYGQACQERSYRGPG